MKVRLYTAQDEFIKEVEIVALHNDLPALVIWGSRYFLLEDDISYTEILAIASVTP